MDADDGVKEEEATTSDRDLPPFHSTAQWFYEVSSWKQRFFSFENIAKAIVIVMSSFKFFAFIGSATVNCVFSAMQQLFFSLSSRPTNSF